MGELGLCFWIAVIVCKPIVCTIHGGRFSQIRLTFYNKDCCSTMFSHPIFEEQGPTSLQRDRLIPPCVTYCLTLQHTRVDGANVSLNAREGKTSTTVCYAKSNGIASSPGTTPSNGLPWLYSPPKHDGSLLSTSLCYISKQPMNPKSSKQPGALVLTIFEFSFLSTQKHAHPRKALRRRRDEGGSYKCDPKGSRGCSARRPSRIQRGLLRERGKGVGGPRQGNGEARRPQGEARRGWG
jgi:hypothetical protein